MEKKTKTNKTTLEENDIIPEREQSKIVYYCTNTEIP